MANLLLSVIGTFAQFMRELIRERQRDHIGEEARSLRRPQAVSKPGPGFCAAQAVCSPRVENLRAQNLGVMRDTV